MKYIVTKQIIQNQNLSNGGKLVFLTTEISQDMEGPHDDHVDLTINIDLFWTLPCNLYENL